MPAPEIASFLRTLSVAAIPVVFGITLHEVAHGWMARRFGDRTAEMLGRLSLNPLKHVDPVGTVLVPLLMLWWGGFLFGWAKPVPVNSRLMRDPRRAMIAVASAGPLANFVMALGWAVGLRAADMLPAGLGEFVGEMASFGLFFNVLLALFNLLPIPPLDGGRVLRGFVSGSFGRLLDSVEPYGTIIVVALLATGVLNRLMGPMLNAVGGALLYLAGVRS
jgi:Zn-dependent protease